MLLVTVKKKCGLLKVSTKCGWFAKGLGKRWMVYFLKQKVHVIRLQLVYKKGKWIASYDTMSIASPSYEYLSLTHSNLNFSSFIHNIEN